MSDFRPPRVRFSVPRVFSKRACRDPPFICATLSTIIYPRLLQSFLPLPTSSFPSLLTKDSFWGANKLACAVFFPATGDNRIFWFWLPYPLERGNRAGNSKTTNLHLGSAIFRILSQIKFSKNRPLFGKFFVEMEGYTERITS